MAYLYLRLNYDLGQSFVLPDCYLWSQTQPIYEENPIWNETIPFFLIYLNWIAFVQCQLITSNRAPRDATLPATLIVWAHAISVPVFHSRDACATLSIHEKMCCTPTPIRWPLSLCTQQTTFIYLSLNFIGNNLIALTLVQDDQNHVNSISVCRATNKWCQCPRQPPLCVESV